MRSLLIALAAVSLAGCFLFKEDQVIDPPAELVDFSPALKVKRVWRAKIGREAERLRLGLVPATDGGRVYAAAHNGKFAAFDTKNGKRYWMVDTDLALAAGPGVNAGLAVAGSDDGELIALKTRDGAELWRSQVGGEILAAPAVARELVVVRTVDGRVLGLSARDGSVRWTYQQSVPPLSLRGTAAPVIVNEVVLCGFDNGKITALALETGDLLWESTLSVSRGRTELEKLVDINAAVSVVGNDVFAVSYQGRAAKIFLESGDVSRATDISGHTPVALDDTTAYLTSDISEVVAMSRRDLTRLWTQSALVRRGLTGPVIHGPAVVVGDFEGYLHWLSREDGEMMARERVSSDAISSGPIVHDGILYVLSDGSELSAYEIVPPKKPGKRKQDRAE